MSGSIRAVPVFLSFKVSFKTLLNSPEKTSSTLLANANLEKGLYSKEVTLFLLNGKINLSSSCSLIFINLILLDAG